ncbi:conidial pigment biosynthesis oxidase Arb2/brown2 [Aspergillus sergii]|uniref:Conidial pigment biosynthesis oxidase Arb2/brown2 n=1 Tax=Aspergillus sergii TaxID=1034303 RepID=A0A5N6X2B0_9EURO|nr:conidial pigment biosynthesis oxidase Arb2/brown2 [Aspergillus sergii]
MKLLFNLLLAAFAFLGVHSKLVREEIVLTWDEGAPNGQARDMIKMNGGFPGPKFYWDEGDDIEVLVHNAMPFNASIHWHGLEMHGTPWSDGATGLTQAPIEVGDSYVYRFKAYPAGTYWYHGHIRTITLDGLYGGIFIRPKPETLTPWHLITNDTDDIKGIEQAVANPELVVVSDWSQFKSWDYIEAEKAANLNLFCVDSILINGKGNVYCPGEDYLVNHTMNFIKWAIYPQQVSDKGCLPYVWATQGRHLRVAKPQNVPRGLQKGCIPGEGDHDVIEVDPAVGWASLNFIDAATFKATVFTIADHPMWIYEVDGHYIEPQRVDIVRQYAGERYAVLIKLNNTYRDYTIQVADDGISQVLSGYATLRYKGHQPDGIKRPTALDYGARNVTPITWPDREHLRPYPPLQPATHSDALHVLNTSRWTHAWQHTLSGGGLYNEDENAYRPLLHNRSAPTEQMEKDLIIQTKNGTWVDLVVQVASHPLQKRDAPHVLHKHTTKMWQIGAGMGIWNYSTTEEAMQAQPEAFSLDNPNYRDTFVTGFDGPSWVVMRYHATNPGPWMFHCHVETHFVGGMSVAILDGIDAWPEVPPDRNIPAKGAANISEISPSEDRAVGDTPPDRSGWNAFVDKLVVFLRTWSPQA